MSARVHVRRVTEDDAATVRSLRLEALADAPDDFDTTIETARAWTTADWEAWIARGATFVLEDAGEPKGIAAGVPHSGDPDARFLEAMWVRADVRGTGAADALVASVLSWAEGEGAGEVWLHVEKSNERARRLYLRNGFRPTGEETTRERDGVLEVVMRRPRGGRT